MEDSIWVLPKFNNRANHLASDLGVSLETAQILVNRDIKTKQEAQEFLFSDLEDLYDPYQMDGMEEAVKRIEKAVKNQEKILVFGDYDVDGILSIVILMKAIESIGGCIEYFIPNRLEDGYGIKTKHLEVVLKRKIGLVISVDCGIKAVDFTKKAKTCGVDVIITDHHLPGTDLPKATAVLNPAISNSSYPDKNLAGVGVVFKLIQALLDKRNKSSVLFHYLKLVCIGTIADMAKLRGENRLFVKYGLEGLEKVSNKGLKSLLSVCGIGCREVTTGDIGFRIAPRLNAAGRLGKGDLSVELFRTQDETESNQIALHLDKLNSMRQQAEIKIFNQAVKKIEKNGLDKEYKILVLGSQHWHRGIMGIVASRLKDLYYRPVLLFSYKNGKAFGSGRSIKDFSLINCVKYSSRFCINYGGHPLAVGCELDFEKFDDFRRDINHYAESKIDDKILKKKIKIDAKIDFKYITNDLFKEINLMKPYGVGNPKPVFLSEGVCIASKPRILKGKHSKIIVKKGLRFFEALGWGRKDWAKEIERGDYADILFSLNNTEYLGEKKLNLTLHDIRPIKNS